MINQTLIASGKLLSSGIKLLNLGNGSTWPGHIALKVNPQFIQDMRNKSHAKIIFVIGTNGKTTTTSLVRHILSSAGKTVIQNESGANLLNGVASTLLLNASLSGKVNADVVLLELDENAFPQVAKVITPDSIIILNLFRDQLDRYGEVNTIAKKWKEALEGLPKTMLFLNADDPQIAFIGEKSKHTVYYFGADVNEAKKHVVDHASDSSYCPNCQQKLTFSSIFYSHVGIWKCPQCSFRHPQDVFVKSPSYPLTGLYNKYNTNAAALFAKKFGIPDEVTSQALLSFKPAFGRQEKITYKGKPVQIILSKNPAGFNQSLETILSYNPRVLILALNDRTADGHDVSWIWDTDVELLRGKDITLILSGDRSWDLGVRMKYAGLTQGSFQVVEDITQAVHTALQMMKSDDTLFVLPTYTAMLDIRKVLTGKKIL